MRIAAITMVYNETFRLPFWLSYYSSQLGAEHLYVVDHGSTDRSTDNLGGANRILLPRDSFDDAQRSRFIAKFHESLLEYYDWVIYTDCDEILIADPAKHHSLKHFVASNPGPVAITAIGLNLIHLASIEPPLELGKPLLSQRRYCYFNSPMCKTLLARKPTDWSGGFHSSSHQPTFVDGFYLFHLHMVDRDENLKRLQLTRDLNWSKADEGLHQRETNETLISRYRGLEGYPRADEDQFNFRTETDRYLSEVEVTPQGRFGVRKGFYGRYVHKIPARFSSLL
jgi:hypothetical protein